MPTIIKTVGTGGGDTPVVPDLPIGSFTFTDSTGKKVTKTNLEWADSWTTFTPTQKESIRQALVNSGYFDSTLSIGTTQTAWTDITTWAATEANASNDGKKWDLGKHLSNAGGAIGQMPNAYLTYGTVLAKPTVNDTTGEKQTSENAFLELKKFAYDNGIIFKDSSLKDWAYKVGYNKDGTAQTIDNVKQTLRDKYVLPKYAGFADEIKAGFNVRDIAHDYVQMVATSLEVDPNSLDLNDNLIQQALKPSKNKDGSFAYISYADFQNNVKKDKRWATTENAHATMSDMAAKIQNAFGF